MASATDTAQVESDDFQKIALFNDLVLRKIFTYLSIGDISHCRVVCRKWKETADPLFNDRLGEIGLVFKQPTDVQLFLRMLDNSELEFENFHFKNCRLTQDLINPFIIRCASSIRKLEFDYNRHQVDRYGDDLEQNSTTSPGIRNLHLRSFLINGAPFLKELEITNLPPAMKKAAIFERVPNPVELEIMRLILHFKHRTGQFETNFLKSLLKASPKLRELRVKSDYDCYEETMDLLNSVIANPIIIPNLTHLDLDSVDEEIVETLLTKFTTSIQLKRFTCKSITGLHALQLESFLDTQKQTLEYLSLSFSSGGKLATLPIIPNLKHLELMFSTTWESVPICVLTYGLQFPKLETLKLFHRVSEDSYTPENWFAAQTPCKTVRYLALPGGLENNETLIRIANIFPNVTKLNLAAQKYEVLRSLWAAWPNLKILAVSLDSAYERKRETGKDKESWIIDSIFTGIPESHCKLLADKFSKQEYTFDEGKLATLHKFRTGPSICNLQGLRRLIIQGGADLAVFLPVNPSHFISDVTGYLGFANLKELIDIDIRFCKNKLSPSCIEYLSSALNLSAKKHRGEFLRFEREFEDIENFPVNTMDFL